MSNNYYSHRSCLPSLKRQISRMIILFLVGCFGFWFGSAIDGLGRNSERHHYLREKVSPIVWEKIVVTFQALATNDNGDAVKANVATAAMLPHFKISENGSCVTESGQVAKDATMVAMSISEQ